MTNTISQSLTTFITQQKDSKGHGNTLKHAHLQLWTAATLDMIILHLFASPITKAPSFACGHFMQAWMKSASHSDTEIKSVLFDSIKKFSILKANIKLLLFIQQCFYFYQSLHLKLHACKRTSEWQIAHVQQHPQYYLYHRHTHTLTHTCTHTITYIHTCTTDPLLPVTILAICSVPKTNPAQKTLFQIRFNQTLILA